MRIWEKTTKSVKLTIGEDDVAAEPPVTRAPAGDGVKEDGDGVVGNLPRGHGLRQELSLELHREVAAGPNWNMEKIFCRIFRKHQPQTHIFYQCQNHFSHF